MSRGADVLVVLVSEVEGRDGAVAALQAEAGRIARALGGRLTAVEIARAAGPDVEASVEVLAAHVRALHPRVVLMLDGDLSRELAPRLALASGSSAIVGCTGVAAGGGTTVYSKPVYGGWLEQELSYADGSLEVATLVGGALSPAPAVLQATAPAGVPDAAPAVLQATAPAGVTDAAPAGVTDEPAVRRLELVPPDYRTVDIVHARRIVAAGMGVSAVAPAPAGPAPVAGAVVEPVADDELMDYVQELAELLEGSVAATRPVVDEGRLPKERLVGQTGKTVAPELYLALGISGSPHHLAGIQGAGTIIAVDRDPAAPIFQFADAGYVADLSEILPALIRRIKEWRDGRG